MANDASKKRNPSPRKKRVSASPFPGSVEASAEEQAARRERLFPIVGIGASAGGLAPFLEILRNLRETPGMAIVFILHQEKHESALLEVVARAAKMPVVTIQDGMTIENNHVYLGPAAMEVTVNDGRFTVKPRSNRTMLIDLFFRTLAADQNSRAIGIVLSGSASDGALGAKAIKEEGGITFAQDDSARFPQMPHAARGVSSVDFVLSPPDIARELMRVTHHTYVSGTPGRLPEAHLLSVFNLLHSAHDVDFTHYKPSTVERRIRRRMALHKIDDLQTYVRLLRQDNAEIEQLYADILIRVTGFFRDPEVFSALRGAVFPTLIENRGTENPVRVWVPGCATGEEVYSIAIALMETASELGAETPVQIFGTDVSDTAIDRARIGSYPENIAGDVSPERLHRYFTKTEGGYRITKAVRDSCVFARQNLNKDPPFSRLDMISCRNVMIYLGSVLQRKVMSIFHYALRPNGFLLLGSSETIGNYGELFEVIDRKHKIYQKKTVLHRVTVDFDAASPRERPEKTRMDDEIASPANIFREADRVMLSRFSPPGVLINDNMEILQFRGRTSLYLEPASGAASFNILKMAREGMLADLRAAIHAARKGEVAVRREGVRVKSNGGMSIVNLEVIPFLTVARERYQLVLFEDVPQPAEPAKKPGRRGKKAEAEEPRKAGRLERARVDARVPAVDH